MIFKAKNLMVSLFILLSLSVGMAEAAASVQIGLGSYELKGDFMSGVMDLVKGKNGIKATVDLTMNSHPYRMACFEGTAVIQGNKLTASSAEGDNAQLVVTFLSSKKLVIKANDEAQGYAGMGAAFDGEYTYVSTKNAVKPPKMTVSAEDLKRMSTFLSNFTEVGYYEIQDISQIAFEELIYFGVRHNLINNKNLIKQRAGGILSIEGKSVIESIKKYLALDIKPSELQSVSCFGQDYDYEGGSYIFPAEKLDDNVYYARVTDAYKDGSKILMEGTIYNIKDPKDILGSFKAYAKPWKYGGKDTWALLSMKLGR